MEYLASRHAHEAARRYVRLGRVPLRPRGGDLDPRLVHLLRPWFDEGLDMAAILCRRGIKAGAWFCSNLSAALWSVGESPALGRTARRRNYALGEGFGGGDSGLLSGPRHDRSSGGYDGDCVGRAEGPRKPTAWVVSLPQGGPTAGAKHIGSERRRLARSVCGVVSFLVLKINRTERKNAACTEESRKFRTRKKSHLSAVTTHAPMHPGG